ncbi:non-ribosomal peptide synthetase [Iningainema tapete]|uniref:Amino acid adenylation domain-containing protein n=1 Tax=Iningainema tapete BLCC-T55 TaxID=2748662 RepID=A0A8J6XUX1_9CYAN|nr:non-ribosomal peptide synthetase [Iningainema tapete]MBD2776527.1 amino acid adenylation domain-containing protein [Iningainema tapete BLCC-T55]
MKFKEKSLNWEKIQQLKTKIESVLLEKTSINDCTVVVKKTSPLEVILYIVSSSTISLEQIRSYLQGVCDEALLPRALVPVSNLPLTATGEVDKLALMKISVIDESLIEQVEKQLNSHHKIEQAVVVVQELRKKNPSLHLSDLLPNWQAKSAHANEAPVSRDSKPNTQQLSEPKPLAISHGGVLTDEPNAPITLLEVLQRAAQQVTSGGIVYLLPDGTELRQSYAELLSQAERILTGLRKLGLKPKDKVILQMELSCDIIPSFWGCLLGGFVPVIMEVPPTYQESNKVVDKLCHIWQFLDSPVILTTADRKQQVESLSQWLPAERLKVSTIEVLKNNNISKSYHNSQPDEVALFNLTSGSTDIPKCVQLTHRNLIARARGTNQLNQHQPEDVILNWLPFDHIGSISDWHIRGVELGCTLVYAQKEYILGRLINWLDLIHKYRITHSWAPNFAYAIVNDFLKQEPEQNWNLSCVKFLLTAGEAVSSKAVEDFRENLVAYGLKATAIRPAFGMAEMGSGITYYQPLVDAPLLFHRVDKFTLQGTIKRVEINHPNHNTFTDLGSVIPGVTIRIVDEQNSVLTEDTIGRLQVKGDAVSPGYYNNHDANQKFFLKDGWFDTGDLGFIANGQLVVTGRAKETIIINGANYYSHEIEAVVEEIEEIEVSYTAACAVCAGGATEKLAIFFNSTITEDKKLLELLNKIRQRVVSKVGLNPDYLILVAKEDIPKTAIGKIQRSQLSDRFHAGQFNPILKKFEILLGNTNTIPDWFYQKVWRPKQATVLKVLSHNYLTIIFVDELGLGTFLCQQLQQQNLPYVCVTLGSDFVKKSPNHFFLAPGNADHYELLLETIKADNLAIGQIIHLWNYQEYGGEIKSLEALEKAQEQGIYSLLFLVQALAKTQGFQDIVRLLFVSSYTQSTQPTDLIAYEKSPVLGVVKTIPQEISWLNCRHIDLTPNRVEENGTYILQEIQVLSTEQEVAYRDGQRFVAGLEKANLQDKPKQELPFKPGGMYLISGGLGGVAVEIAKYLIKFFNAKLLLLGRTPLPDTDASNLSATILDKIKAYQELKQLGTVVYEAVDICDFQATQQVVEKVKANWGSQLDGVIHLAGTYHEQMLVDETPQSVAAILRPKVLGAWVLHQILVNQGQGVFISFSSLASFFGGATICAYAAANNFLESFNQYQRSVGWLHSYCFAWTIWRETGMNKGSQRQEIIHAQGYYDLSVQQGLYSLLAGLYHDQARLIVGLDGSNPKIRRFTSEFQGLQKLTAYYTQSNGSSVLELSDLTVLDRFGTTVNCDFVQLSEMPLNASGEINRNLLVRGMTSWEAIASPPRNETERQIARILQQVLDTPQISIHDNFFALGGNSLLAFQVIARLREAFSVEMAPNRFFASPTVAGLGESLEALLTAAKSAKDCSFEPILSTERSRELPLSFAQQRMWFLYQLESQSPYYNESFQLRIQGVLNVEALEQSINEIIRRHEILRTTFPAVDGKPVQVISPSLAIAVPVLDLQGLEEAEVQQIVTNLARQPFDLSNGPLLRVTLLRLGSSYVLVLILHHIITDGWSMGIFLKELSILYRAIALGSPLLLPELPIQYADFAVWQRQWLTEKVQKQQLNYWKQQLAGAPPLLELPTDKPRPPIQSFCGATKEFQLDRNLTEQIKIFSQHSGATLFQTLLAAFVILMFRYSGQDDICVGSPIANRNRREIETLIGFFVNTLVLRHQIKGNPSFSEFLSQVQQVTMSAYAHQDVPFEQVVEALQPERSLSYNPLFQVMFVLENFSLDTLELPNLTLTPQLVERGTSQFDLSVAVWETKKGLIGSWEYNSDLFEADTIARMTSHFQTLLTAIVANPNQPISELPLLTERERHQLLVEWNNTRTPYPDSKCIHQLFEEQVEKTPNAVAVVYEDESLTYQQLNERANQLAHYLQTLGVKPEVLVGICVERSLLMIVGLLGILKAGGAYVPLDPAYPQERLSFMLSDSQVSVLVTQQKLVTAVPVRAMDVVCLDAQWEIISQQSQLNPSSAVRAGSLAYVIYTSGSTGKPKGVLVTHQGLCNLALEQIRTFDVQPNSRVLQFASLSFDASIWEIVMALCAGARLCLGTLDSLLPGSGLIELMQNQAITHATLPPSALAAMPAAELPNLQTIIVAGEACSANLVAQWSSDRRFVNAYGPTESTVCATTAVCIDSNQKLPIGRPIANTQVYILDDHLQPVLIGVPGELHIGGVGLARGYLNRPELTQQKFIPNPFDNSKVTSRLGKFATEGNPPGNFPQKSKLYKTGDLARYLPDGNIEFLGRIDNQVKIRGFRIELSEIEAVLTQHPQVREVVVIAREDKPGVKSLAAYVVPELTQPTSNELRLFLKSKLPDYMVPASFTVLEVLPITPNGKVDRRALPVPEFEFDESTGFVSPRTHTEEILANIWRDVLGLKQVGIHNNFFELGGDSIIGIQIITRANQAGLKLTPKQLFQHQTIADLAAVAGIINLIQSEQGLVTGVAPLTPIQHWFFEQNLADSHHFNQSFLLEVPPLQPELLEQALQKLLCHHDALRLRFVQQDGQWQQYNSDAWDGVSFGMADLSDLPQAEQLKTIEARANEEQQTLNLADGPLMRVVLFHLGNSPGRLLIIIHHLAVDGISWRVLLEDLSGAYKQLELGKSIQLPAKTTSFKDWAIRLQDYARSQGLHSQLDYWLDSMRFPIAPLPLDYRAVAQDNTVASSRIISVYLSLEQTRALLQDVPSAYNTQINDVLLTALVQTFARWTGSNSLLIDLEGHGREDLFEDVDLSRTVGWFTSIFPVLLKLEEQHTGILKSVKEQLRRIPNRGIGYGILRYLSPDALAREKLQTFPQAEVSFNYLGQFDQTQLATFGWKYAQESSGSIHSPKGQRRHLLIVNALVVERKLKLEWNYSEHFHRRATVENLANDYLKALEDIIVHCLSKEAGGYTPSDFPEVELSQEALDELLAEIE